MMRLSLRLRAILLLISTAGCSAAAMLFFIDRSLSMPMAIGAALLGSSLGTAVLPLSATLRTNELGANVFAILLSLAVFIMTFEVARSIKVGADRPYLDSILLACVVGLWNVGLGLLKEASATSRRSGCNRAQDRG
jgi:hypothetical protein